MNQSTTTKYERSYFSERPVVMVAGLFLLAAIPIGLIVVVMYGSVRGSEFSPDDFTRRHFAYQQIPWLNWTVSGIEYTDMTSELEQTLITNGLIQKKKSAGNKQKTWHLYFDSGVPDSHGCDARFLTEYLDFSDWDSNMATSTPFWTTWNERYPKSARVFWPTVADLARHEMYLIMPEVMRFAMNVFKDKPGPFRSDLSDLVREQWITSGESDLQQANYQRAIERFFRAQEIKSTERLTELIELCRDKVEDVSKIKQVANAAANDLATQIDLALAEDDSKETIASDAAAQQGITAEAIKPADGPATPDKSNPKNPSP